MPSTARIVLRLTDVVKTYPGVVALRSVSFEVLEGEVHALVGENGAGKSTLMSVAAGSTLPDSGRVEIGGTVLVPAIAGRGSGTRARRRLSAPVDPRRPDRDREHGVRDAACGSGRPSCRRTPGRGRSSSAIGASIEPASRVSELSVADRQLLEIAKALALESKVLVLDEPTESLTPVETERLFERIHAITAAGTAVVYISHRLPEVQMIADRITVLRDGETRGTVDASTVSEADVLRLIIGRAVDQAFPPKTQLADGCRCLRSSGLSGPRFRDVDLRVRGGEIIGLAGVEGNGQREFLRALAGLSPAHGEVLRGRLTGSLGQHVENAGCGRRPSTRRPPSRGRVAHLSVRENILVALARRDLPIGVSPAPQGRRHSSTPQSSASA